LLLASAAVVLDAYERLHGARPGRLSGAPLGTPCNARVVVQQLAPWLPDGVPRNPPTGSARLHVVHAHEDAREVVCAGWSCDPRTGAPRAGLSGASGR
jgi:hypothetical protein